MYGQWGITTNGQKTKILCLNRECGIMCSLVKNVSTFLYRIKNIPELAKADKEDCANGIDDDGDFLVDCEDPTCSEDEHCKGNSDKPEDPKPAEKEICDNTIDDDGNGFADCKDPAAPVSVDAGV